jgi:hypothetical protein
MLSKGGNAPLERPKAFIFILESTDRNYSVFPRSTVDWDTSQADDFRRRGEPWTIKQTRLERVRRRRSAKQEIDYGRCGVAGHVFGAFQPALGDALTAAYVGRTTVNWVDLLGKVEGWVDPGIERVWAVVDNLNTHSATDILLFAVAHPRWEFVLQPKYAAYLNLIEPWWKILCSLALKDRRFEA